MFPWNRFHLSSLSDRLFLLVKCGECCGFFGSLLQCDCSWVDFDVVTVWKKVHASVPHCVETLRLVCYSRDLEKRHGKAGGGSPGSGGFVLLVALVAVLGWHLNGHFFWRERTWPKGGTNGINGTRTKRQWPPNLHAEHIARGTLTLSGMW